MDYKSMEGAPKPKQGVLQKYGKTIICSLANFSTAYNLQSIQLAVLFLKGLGHGTFTFSTARPFATMSFLCCFLSSPRAAGKRSVALFNGPAVSFLLALTPLPLPSPLFPPPLHSSLRSLSLPAQPPIRSH